jgi:hypothetical protein
VNSLRLNPPFGTNPLAPLLVPALLWPPVQPPRPMLPPLDLAKLLALLARLEPLELLELPELTNPPELTAVGGLLVPALVVLALVDAAGVAAMAQAGPANAKVAISTMRFDRMTKASESSTQGNRIDMANCNAAGRRTH